MALINTLVEKIKSIRFPALWRNQESVKLLVASTRSYVASVFSNYSAFLISVGGAGFSIAGLLLSQSWILLVGMLAATGGTLVVIGNVAEARLSNSDKVETLQEEKDALKEEKDVLKEENETLREAKGKHDEEMIKLKTRNHINLLNKIGKIQESKSTIDLDKWREKLEKIKQQAQEENCLLPHHQQLILNELGKLISLVTSSHFNPSQNEEGRQQVCRQSSGTYPFFSSVSEAIPDQLPSDEDMNRNNDTSFFH